MSIDKDFEVVRQQLMKAEWPRGGHGTLDNALESLSRIQSELKRLEEVEGAASRAHGLLSRAEYDPTSTHTEQRQWIAEAREVLRNALFNSLTFVKE